MHVHGHAGHATHVELPLSFFFPGHGHRAKTHQHTTLAPPTLAIVEEDDDSRQTTRAQNALTMPMTSRMDMLADVTGHLSRRHLALALDPLSTS
jgi:hypothetical protein